MAFSDFGDFKERITSSYYTKNQAIEDRAKTKQVLDTLVTTSQLDLIKNNVHELQLESMPKNGRPDIAI